MTEKEIIKVTNLKRDKNYHYVLNRDNDLLRFKRGESATKEKIAEINGLKQEPKYLYYICSTDGFITIARAKTNHERKAVKGLKWAKVLEEDNPPPF